MAHVKRKADQIEAELDVAGERSSSTDRELQPENIQPFTLEYLRCNPTTFTTRLDSANT